ncbi:MAG TPA: metal-dependent hydrolase [Thermodesulfobacteriota bacterium]|nr:metal-dependent hydrolase [Thermodesulfobacteriota bacterium]
MPTSIGHALVGLNLWVYHSRKDKRDCLFFVFLSCLPDIDLVPGILIGDTFIYHHLLTHSLFFAFIVALIWSFLFRKRGYIYPFLIALGLICSHIFLDMMNTDTIGVPGKGIMIFYPFSDLRVALPLGFFTGIGLKNMLDLISYRAFNEYVKEGIIVSIPLVYYGLKEFIRGNELYKN